MKRIHNVKSLISPSALKEQLPLDKHNLALITATQQNINAILNEKNDRLLVVVGPCSIHDPKAALEYGKKLSEIREQHKNELEIVMRVYFEKPRTIHGWKGLINDPKLNNTFEINDGLYIARALLIELTQLQVPTAGEFLDMVTPHYMSELFSWGAIGARTTESQIHRALASGLDCPIGFKNGTHGNIKIACDAIHSANSSHHYLSIDDNGEVAIVETKGNPDTHIILRGGTSPNYDPKNIATIKNQLKESGLAQRIMVDCSHGNCEQQYHRQLHVIHSICQQLEKGENSIFGVMLESHLVEGKQPLLHGNAEQYGQSITDPCLGWEDTLNAVNKLADAVKKRRYFSLDH